MKPKELVEQTISKAAIKANISPDQSRKCIKAALKYLNQQTQLHGILDLSGFGLPKGAHTSISDGRVYH